MALVGKRSILPLWVIYSPQHNNSLQFGKKIWKADAFVMHILLRISLKSPSAVYFSAVTII